MDGHALSWDNVDMYNTTPWSRIRCIDECSRYQALPALLINRRQKMNKDDINEKIKKLPKWAQMEFKRLERDINRLENRLELANNEVNKPAFYVYDILDSDEKHWFTDRCIARFPVGSDRLLSHIDISLRDGNLLIHSSGDELIIKPHASNSITLMMKDFS